MIKRNSDDLLQVEEGSLYPALQRMLKNGWVGAEWGISRGIARCVSTKSLRQAAATGARSVELSTNARRHRARNEGGAIVTWRNLDRETQAHIEEKVLDLIESGIPEKEARERARREFGNHTATIETSREQWGWSWLERIWQDLVYARRILSRTRASR